ncbi:MAG: hypothetical protein LBT89_02060 [Planctomycetaceae bacterium]|jgi:hypothetical protein|nr:hypothetical protein [Planctomycetaceae bacterium]
MALDFAKQKEFQIIVSCLSEGGTVKAEWYDAAGNIRHRINVKKTFVGLEKGISVIFGIDEFGYEYNLSDADISCIREQ